MAGRTSGGLPMTGGEGAVFTCSHVRKSHEPIGAAWIPTCESGRAIWGWLRGWVIVVVVVVLVAGRPTSVDAFALSYGISFAGHVARFSFSILLFLQ